MCASFRSGWVQKKCVCMRSSLCSNLSPVSDSFRMNLVLELFRSSLGWSSDFNFPFQCSQPCSFRGEPFWSVRTHACLSAWTPECINILKHSRREPINTLKPQRLKRIGASTPPHLNTCTPERLHTLAPLHLNILTPCKPHLLSHAHFWTPLLSDCSRQFFFLRS